MRNRVETRYSKKEKREESGRERNGAYGTESRAEKAESCVGRERRGPSISDVILVGVLLAAGASLKFFCGFAVFRGDEAEFHNSYVLSFNTYHKAEIQRSGRHRPSGRSDMPVFPGTPYLNFVSELVGAVVMAAFMRILSQERADSPLCLL